MAEREADRARSELLSQQAMLVLMFVGGEISPEFRRQLRDYDEEPRLFGADELAAAARTSLEAEIARDIEAGLADSRTAVCDALRRRGDRYAREQRCQLIADRCPHATIASEIVRKTLNNSAPTAAERLLAGQSVPKMNNRVQLTEPACSGESGRPMIACAPTGFLHVAEDVSNCCDRVAVLGRDIRTLPERIARYCVIGHEPVYEDLATLVESMAYLDRRIVRRRAQGWTRDLSIRLPMYEHARFQRAAAVEALTETAWFLTGDHWSFEFVARKGPLPSRQGALPFPSRAITHVVPFSDGLDSFAQVQLSVREYGRDAVMLVRSGLGRDRIFPDLTVRVPRKFSGRRMREVSYRTRPLVFYTLAAIGAAVTKAEAVAIGENGQDAIGPACLPFADEWWFRSAHPAFLRRWAKFLKVILEKPIRFEQPHLWNTKGEVLSNLQAQDLVEGWERTNSCSTRPKDRYGRRGCGNRGGCLLRTVSAHAAGLTWPIEDNAFDLYALEDFSYHRDGGKGQMTATERAVAVRAIDTMAGFARLADSPDGKIVIQREARQIDPMNPEAAQTKLLRLVKQHQTEWDNFVSRLSKQSWIREIIGQL